MSGFRGSFGFTGLGSFGYLEGDESGGFFSHPSVSGTPVLAQALEGDNLSLAPATVTPPGWTPQTFTLYINSAPVPGYVGVNLATLQSYVWQAADEWLDAYVEQSIPLLGVTLTSNTVNVDGLDNLIFLVQTDAGAVSGYSPATGNNEFRFYGNAASTYDINWGDGTIQNGVTGIQTRTYASIGTYRVKARNWISATKAYTSPVSATTDAVKLLELQQWGTTAWTSAAFMFIFAARMVGIYKDVPNLSGVTSLQSMFFEARLFNGSVSAPPMGTWDVSGVTVMAGTFQNAIAFNQDISGWDVSSVTNMNVMFSGATSFNQPIGSWDVSSVVTLVQAFQSATSFNQALGTWFLNDNVILTSMLNNCGMSTENYSRTLIGWANEWSATGTPTGRSLGAVGRTYHNTVYGGAPYDNAVSARAALVAPTPGGAGWTITGDALV
jgi:surface protein